METQIAKTPVTIENLMKQWAIHRAKADALEAEILRRVSGPIEVPGYAAVKASISKGSYDYEGIARKLKISDEIIKKYESVVTDWKSACEEVGIPQAIKDHFYKQGVEKTGPAKWNLKLNYVQKEG
jgi:hypothetical protein